LQDPGLLIAVFLMILVLRDVTLCSSPSSPRRFELTFHLHLQSYELQEDGLLGSVDEEEDTTIR
jgi:hypothetical protein